MADDRIVILEINQRHLESDVKQFREDVMGLHQKLSKHMEYETKTQAHLASQVAQIKWMFAGASFMGSLFLMFGKQLAALLA